MTTKKLVLAAAVVAAVGGGLAGLTAAGPGTGDRPAGGAGYTVTTAGSAGVLLDPASGDTWVLRPDNDPTWVPVKRAVPPRPPATPPAAPKADPPPAVTPEAPAAFQALGLIAPARSTRVHAPAAGVVSKVMVTVGQEVKAGDVLFTLDDTQAKLAVQAAQVELDLASLEFSNKVNLYQKKVITSVEVKQAELTMRRQDVAVQGAKARLDAARAVAPFAGTVVEVNAQPGDAAGPTAAAVEIATLGELVAVVNLAENSLPRCAAGQRCVVTASDGITTYPGAVERVGATIDPRTGTAVVRVKVEVPTGKPAPRPGLSVLVRFEPGK